MHGGGDGYVEWDECFIWEMDWMDGPRIYPGRASARFCESTYLVGTYYPAAQATALGSLGTVMHIQYIRH